MLRKLNNRPLWYQLWAVTTGLAAVYCLVKHFVYGLDSVDYLIQVFVLVSILTDYYLFTEKKSVRGNRAEEKFEF